MFKVGSGEGKIKFDDGSEVAIPFADDDLSSMLFAATGGIGVQYPLGPGSFVAELRGFYPFTQWINEDLSPDVWESNRCNGYGRIQLSAEVK